jgi:hypothetical protein
MNLKLKMLIRYRHYHRYHRHLRRHENYRRHRIRQHHRHHRQLRHLIHHQMLCRFRHRQNFLDLEFRCRRLSYCYLHQSHRHRIRRLLQHHRNRHGRRLLK